MVVIEAMLIAATGAIWTGQYLAMAVPAVKLEALAQSIADCREGEIARLDVAHIGAWLNRFDEGVRETLLDEVTHVLGKSFNNRE
ncbi:MAG: hypothetical protein IT537_27090 [Hyphomicrobiales bacterium]|nr:hypothetical protein [Hyphomicrobiales bacterium]